MGDASKRRRIDGTATPVPEEPVTHSELMGLLKNLKTELADDSKKHSQQVGEKFEKLVVDYDVSVQSRLAHIDANIQGLKTQAAGFQNDHIHMRGQIEQLQKAVALAERQTVDKSIFAEERFDREVDPTIIKVNTEELISKTSLIQAISGWIEETAPMQSVDIKGPDSEPSDRFIIQFKGAAGLAAQRVSKALGSLKRADGSWTDLHAKAPGDGNRLVRVYVGRDKNPKQTTTERGCKKLLLALKTVHPGINAHALKRPLVHFRAGVVLDPAGRVLPDPVRPERRL